jgi:phosphate transport system substrate-binding protein
MACSIRRAVRPGQNSYTRLLFDTRALALVFVITWLGGCVETATQQPGSVLVKGSETMQPLVAMCAEQFMSKHSHTDVIVQGGGSGTGLSALFHGTVDISMVSRDVSNKERAHATSKGFDLREYALGLDGIAIVVHPDNHLKQLELGQLRKIFTGRTRSWHEVGGARRDMVVLARTASSGTSDLFVQRVLSGEEYAQSVKRLSTNSAIIEEVARDPLAIGYSGLETVHGARDRVKIIALQSAPKSVPTLPILETIRSGSYPLARTLHFYTVEEPSGSTKEFIEFCLSSQGQKLVRKAGFIPIEH